MSFRDEDDAKTIRTFLDWFMETIGGDPDPGAKDAVIRDFLAQRTEKRERPGSERRALGVRD